jgi:hypothetical protein
VPDDSFEFRLERMFSEAPAMPDADLFVARVLARADRGWTARRLLIGVMGAAGGLIGAGQFVGSGALGALAALGTQSSAYITNHLNEELAGLLPSGVGVDGQVILTAAVLALIAAGFGLARLIREI